ncbi:MAG: hypothetical protein AAB504_01870 [Patescibacteria group bacterium]
MLFIVLNQFHKEEIMKKRFEDRMKIYLIIGVLFLIVGYYLNS